MSLQEWSHIASVVSAVAAAIGAIVAGIATYYAVGAYNGWKNQMNFSLMSERSLKLYTLLVQAVNLYVDVIRDMSIEAVSTAAMDVQDDSIHSEELRSKINKLNIMVDEAQLEAQVLQTFPNIPIHFSDVFWFLSGCRQIEERWNYSVNSVRSSMRTYTGIEERRFHAMVIVAIEVIDLKKERDEQVREEECDDRLLSIERMGVQIIEEISEALRKYRS